MASLTWIIFGIFVVCCSAHFGIDRTGQNFQQRRFGPICVSHFREPVYRYFRVPVCCPGYAMDKFGKCSIRLNQLKSNIIRNNGPSMSAASQMSRAMWEKARQDMDRRRAMFFMNMRNNNRDNVRNNGPMMMPRMPIRKPPMSPMFNVFNRRQPIPNQPRVAFLKFNRPTSSVPPMPHPVQQPPLSGRMIKIIKRKIIPLFPFIQRNDFPMSMRQDRIRPPMIPRVVLSGRVTNLPMNRLREFHPPSIPSLPRIEPNFQPSFMNNNYPEENVQQTPDSQQDQEQFQPDGFHNQHHGHQNTETNDIYVPMPGESQMPAENVMQVDLPNEPVQMPDLVVEQAPANNLNQDSCIVKLESAVKTCLKQNNIDVPDVMSAFEPFNDDKSRALCEAEDNIFVCITEALKDCDQSNDATIAREMLLETAQTVQAMCDMRQTNVGQGDSTQTEAANVQGTDTVSTVENVDAIPTDVNAAPTPDKEEITIIEDRPASPDTPSAEAVKEAIQHEVHVQEMRMKEYLLPILVGAGVGFMILVLFMSLLICCCCKRKMKRKMKMAKELEKPPLQDGIYTIGIAPPTYEVNGIPPMYYEEAKGEKITSRSSSVLEGTTQAEEPEDVKM